MLPPRELLAEIVECIDRFVAGQGPLGGGAAGPPAPHAQPGCGVPWDLGGLQRADISAQVYALLCSGMALAL